LRPAAILCSAAALLLAVAACLLGNGYQIYLVAMVCLTAVVGAGLNVLLGLTGQVSLGHVGFFAIGAYTVAILTTASGASFWLSLPAATVLAGVVGMALALPALRVAGPYLAMVTIAFGFIVENGAIEWRSLTGGANGIMNIPAPAIGGYEFQTRDIALLAIVIAALVLLAFRELDRSAWGRAMRAVRNPWGSIRSRFASPRSPSRQRRRGLRGRYSRRLPASSARAGSHFSSRSCSCW
jgi:branched-chain amino acid transport system ATP-binding protein